MLRQIIEKKLQELGKKYKQTGDEWFLTTCLNPNHNDSKPSFHINFNSGFGKCFSCGYEVNKDYWLNGIVENEYEIKRNVILNNIKKKLKKEEKETHQVILPPHNEDITFNYRGISKELWNKLDCYICRVGKYKNRIVIPIKYNNEVKAFETRALNDNMQPKYLHSKGFDVKSLIYPDNLLKENNKNYIILVEGIMDAISGWELNIPTIANFGVADNVNQEKIKKLIELGIDKIYITFDKDKAGAKGNIKMLKHSYYNKFFKVKLGIELKELQGFYKSNYKDLNDYLQNIRK